MDGATTQDCIHEVDSKFYNILKVRGEDFKSHGVNHHDL